MSWKKGLIGDGKERRWKKNQRREKLAKKIYSIERKMKTKNNIIFIDE